jgi:hypothetical protein
VIVLPQRGTKGPEGSFKSVTARLSAGRTYYVKIAVSLAVLLGLLLVLRQNGPWLLSSALIHTTWLLLAGFSVWVFGRKRGEQSAPCTANNTVLTLLFTGLCLYLVSSATLAKWFYLMDWMKPTQGQPFPTMPVWAVASALLAVVVALRPRSVRWLIVIVFIAGMTAALAKFLLWTDGEALYRDDHPSFMFRIWLMLETFPQMRNYLPMWNAGALDIAWLVSGIRGLVVPWWPFFGLFPVEQIYTPVLGLTFAVFVPIAAVFSVRGLGLPWGFAAVAGCLSLGVSQHFFLWLLNYGTIGASLTMTFVVPVSALVFRSIWFRKPGWGVGVCLILAATFLLSWQPGTIMLAAMLPGALLCWRRLSARKIWFLVVCGTVTVVLFIPTALTIFTRDASVATFALSGKPVEAIDWSLAMWKAGGKHLAAHLVEMHPALLIFGLVGLFGAVPRGIRLFYLPLCLILAFLTGWGPALMPNLQLSRMGIPLAFALVVPATITLSRLLRTERISWNAMRAAIILLLAAGVWSTARIYGNEAKFKVSTIVHAQTVIDWIKTEQPQEGRVLFAGSTVHGFGGGHIAYLPVMTGREMCAVDYYHFPPEMVFYEYPPAAFLNSEQRIIQFMEWHDVSHVLTIRDHWKEFLNRRSDVFERLHDEDGISMFRMKRPVSRWLQGSGSITTAPNRIDVAVDDPAINAIIKYVWVDGLRVNAPAELFSHELDPDLHVIGIRPNGVREIHITFEP